MNQQRRKADKMRRYIFKSLRAQKSDELAQIVCRELRHQLSSPGNWDSKTLIDHLLHWLHSTGNVKFVRPDKPKKKGDL
jgi:hypothetical protein